MDGHSFQPPLLSLQDMLNLSDNEDYYDCSGNPFDISHFFEPIDSTKKSPTKSKVKVADYSSGQGQNANGYYYSAGQTTSNFTSTDPFFEPVEPTSNLVEVDYNKDAVNEGNFRDFEQQLDAKRKIKLEHYSKTLEGSQEEESYVSFPNDPLEEGLETFDINFVTSEIKASGATDSDSETECYDFLPIPNIGDTDGLTLRNKNVSDTEQNVLSYHSDHLEDTPTPRLAHVTLENVDKEEALKTKAVPINRVKNKCRLEAIEQLQSIINTLKRYSRTLGDFLAHEGESVLVEYDARNTLSEILPDISGSGDAEHPLYLAHTMTKLLVNRVKGQTVLSKLPRRKPLCWKTSELLLLQEFVLESVISKGIFFLQCRFSEIMTDMGFDSDDLHKLSQCVTQQSELIALQNILQEHNFFCNIKNSSKQKNPILSMTFKKNKQSGTPQVVSFPTPESLVIDKWKKIKEIRRNTFLSNISKDDVDWLFVTKKLFMSESSLDVDEAACQLAFDHILCKRINNQSWSKKELIKLRDIRLQSTHLSWDEIATRLSTNRTPFSCFVKYKLYCMDSQNPKSLIPYRTLRSIEDCIEHYKGNIGAVDLKLSRQRGYNLKPRGLLSLCRNRFNKRHKKGHYATVEDVLLLVAMEKCKMGMKDGDIAIFESVAYALPWRHTQCWRTRLNVLLTGIFHKHWTLAMDRKLLELVEQYGPKYKIIERHFTYKNRKQCRARYMKIQSDLQRMSLEDFHLIYRDGRKNFKLSRLNSIAEYLQMTIRAKCNGNGSVNYLGRADLEFLKLRQVPTDSNLEFYLKTFPVKVMILALDRLSQTLMYILDKIEQSQNIEGKPTFRSGLIKTNRRSFNHECPASVGSALHLRHVQLFPVDKVDKMNDFELNVYFYWKQFCLQSVGKVTTQRRSIPTAEFLRKLPSIQRILVPIAPQLGAPVIVFPSSTNPDKVRSMEQDFLQELERKKKGGALKGSKRKSTIMKEMRAKAAKTRWLRKAQESAAASYPNCDSEDGQSISIDFPVDVKPDLNELEQPNTSCNIYESVNPATKTRNAIREATIGLLSDHAYYSSTCNPSDFSSLTLSQLLQIGDKK